MPIIEWFQSKSDQNLMSPYHIDKQIDKVSYNENHRQILILAKIFSITSTRGLRLRVKVAPYLLRATSAKRYLKLI